MTRGHVNLLEWTADDWERDEFLAALLEEPDAAPGAADAGHGPAPDGRAPAPRLAA